LTDVGDEYVSSEMWHETMQQKDGTIRRRKETDTGFVTDSADLILSGPHFYVANPLHQTPMRVCRTHRAYDHLELSELPDDYLPRTNPDVTKTQTALLLCN
jgi:hypothetical protein